MVLVQEDDPSSKPVVYYLSNIILHVENQYSHVEKLALEIVIIVQIFRHYILLWKTTLIVDSNLMYHILT